MSEGLKPPRSSRKNKSEGIRLLILEVISRIASSAIPYEKMTSPTGFSPGFEEPAETFCPDLPSELDSSGSMNVQEPPEKMQRSESGGMPTSSQKSQSVRPACAAVKARADAQEEPRRESVLTTRRESVLSRGPPQDPRSPNVFDHSPRSETPRRESDLSAGSSRAQSSPTAAADVESIVSSVPCR